MALVMYLIFHWLQPNGLNNFVHGAGDYFIQPIFVHVVQEKIIQGATDFALFQRNQNASAQHTVLSLAALLSLVNIIIFLCLNTSRLCTFL